MTKLSVNINKVALIRNSRGADFPNLVKVAQDCEEFGADGITVHPRPDQRHVKYSDIEPLKYIVSTELNIEGYPSEEFILLVLKNKPAQVTLVPDKPGALTSDAGWDTMANKVMLSECISRFQDAGIRVSLFVDPVEHMVIGAKDCGADRIELYTGPYAHQYHKDRANAVLPYHQAANTASAIGIAVNAGHDLNLENLKYLKENIPLLAEVSIGHALIVDAMYYGLKNTILMYKHQLSLF